MNNFFEEIIGKLIFTFKPLIVLISVLWTITKVYIIVKAFIWLRNIHGYIKDFHDVNFKSHND
ncbi:hypothetical protein AWE51_10035 [Aquimarina aggregata]|uniref:Uncharacterized protein n=1 Tax=Aquimarina aggregata TaxID=1642818 RepID=A0A162ZR14_9FLAO|nr:hypothetical protein AWE51_10035 [Aquimarina aggregata]